MTPSVTPGVYVLQSVSGLSPLPVAFTDTSGYAISYVADTVFIHADSTWSDHLIQQVFVPGWPNGTTTTTNVTNAGTYTQVDSSLTLDWVVDRVFDYTMTATVSSGTITVVNPAIWDYTVDLGFNSYAFASVSNRTTTLSPASTTTTFVYRKQ